MAGNAITRITGSRDMYSPGGRGHQASVNFLTCHDGFTLYDLYSYNTKHNEKNGWTTTDTAGTVVKRVRLTMRMLKIFESAL